MRSKTGKAGITNLGNDDKCCECWWYWTSAGGYDCHHSPRPRGYNPLKTDGCGYFEPKAEAREQDPGREYERFQEEWN